MGVWQPGKMRILSSRQESGSNPAHTSEATTFRICKPQSTPYWHCGLTVLCRVLRPRRSRIGYVIARTSPNSRKPVPGGSSGVALTRNAPTWNGPPATRCNLDQIQWDPQSTSVLWGGLATLMFASRYVVTEQVTRQHWTDNRWCSAIRPVTGRQVITLFCVY